MAKRKRATASTTLSRKRTKAGAHPHGNFDPKREYKVRSIVGETTTQYRIAWEPDEETGEIYDDTWEPKANANKQAVDDWILQQADKKRVEFQSGGAAVQDSSRTPSSEHTPPSSKKRTPPKPKRGRAREVVESSPPPASDRSQTNGHSKEPAADGVLEIGESQQSEPTCLPTEQPGATSPSPLFVSDREPAAESYRTTVAVAPPPPPSSYLAGGYEVISSSQVLSSDPPIPSQPEPSQFFPDPADTTGTTEGITEVSEVQTTPSQHVHSLPVNFGETPGLVADSQSLPGSSSFVPSAEKSTSHPDSTTESIVTNSARAGQPETDQARDNSNEESAEVQAPEVERSTSDWTRDQNNEDSAEVQAVEAAQEASGQDFTSAVSEQPDPPTESLVEHPPLPEKEPTEATDQIVNSLEQTDPPKTPVTSQPVNSISTYSPVVTKSSPAQEAESRESRKETPSPPPQASEGAAQAQDDSEDLDTRGPLQQPHPDSTSTEEPLSAQLRSQSPQASEGAVQQQEDSETLDRRDELDQPHLDFSSIGQPTSAQPQVVEESTSTASRPEPASEQLDSSTLSETPDHQSTQRNGQVEQIETAQPTSIAQLEDEAEPGAIRPNPSQVDLAHTTQEPPTSIAPFSVTPIRNAIPIPRPYPQQRPPDSSDWQSQSPFPFQTQLQHEQSISTANHEPHQPDFRTETPSQAPNRPSDSSEQPEYGSGRPLQTQPRLESSNTLPQPPSQSIHTTLGENAPPRPELPSTPRRPLALSMDNSQSKPGHPRKASEIFGAKLKAAREKAMRERAERRGHVPTSAPGNKGDATSQLVENQSSSVSASTPAVTVTPNEAPAAVLTPKLASPLLFAQDAVRSPSAVPYDEPLPMITQEEMTTSARYETLLPQAQQYGADDQRNGSLTSAGTPTRPNEDGAENADLHTIPISMGGSQGDHYPNTVYYYRDSIKRFLEDSNPDTELVDRLKDFVERMRRITMHLDLDDPETLTQWDVDAADLADWDVKCSAKFRFLWELFLALRDQDIAVAIVACPGRVVDMLEIFLQGKQIPYQRLGTTPPKSSAGRGGAKAILLDTSTEVPEFEHADLVIGMENLVRHDTPLIRNLRRQGDRWAPFVSLIVPYSVEHIERCLPPDLSDRQVGRALVNGIWEFRKQAGRLESEQSTKEAAKALAQYLMRTDDSDTWPITGLTQLQDLDNQTESDLYAEATPPGVRSGTKRSREPEGVDSAADSNKRTRVEPQSSAANADVTHISDSIDKSTHSKGSGSHEKAHEQRAEDSHLTRLLQQALDDRDGHQRALADLQFRFEEQRTELVEVKRERDRAILTATNAADRLSEQSNGMSGLRAKRSELEQELKAAKERLLDQSIPERAEFEALRAAAAQAKVDKEKAESKLQRAEKDLEYVRGLYQNSSSSAQELATRNTELENQVAVLQNKATGEQVKLRQMYLDNFSKSLQSENKKLKIMMKDRDAAIKFRDEEISKLKDASRGRIGTRGSSIPRTPRVGSPMKGRVGSRQTSPAAGEVRERNTLLHPLRNAQGQ